METSPIITFLLTQNLRGDLRFLPRLGRILWQKRRDEQRTYTFDLGGACAPEAWHCEATDGRSMLIALDGLNYAAANVEGLTLDSRMSLHRTLMGMRLIDSMNPAELPYVALAAVKPAQSADPDRLTAVLAPTEARLVDGILEFPPVPRYQVASMRVVTGPAPEIDSLEFFDVPDDTPPDGTLSGMVDFIESEARMYQRRKADKDDSAQR